MIKLFKYHNLSIFFMIASACTLYLLFLFIYALYQQIEIVLYNLPILIITLYSIYKMVQKKLSYEITIEFKGYAGWIAFICMVTSVICFSLIKDQYDFNYSFINFWKNILITKYNNLFFFTYNILCLSVLGVLLTFNNIENVKEYYKRQKLKDYSPWYTNILMLFIIFVINFTFFKELNQITSSYFYFLGITYISAFIWVLICRIIICFFNTISLFLKG